MEENDLQDPVRSVDSEKESNRAMLPLLQPPGNQQSHRITNFYIHNILRPDFGRKEKDRNLVQEGKSLEVIIRREELQGKKSSKTSNSKQAGGEKKKDMGASDDRHLDNEACKPNMIASDFDGDLTVKDSTQASTDSTAKSMLWPAWVYCTRYSDRPSSGWLKLLSHFSSG